MRKVHIILPILLVLATLVLVILKSTMGSGEISCRIVASYDEQGRYLLVDPEGVVSIKELRAGDEVFSSSEEKDTFMLRYPWKPGERLKISAKTSRGKCTAEVTAPELENKVRVHAQALPGVLVINVDSTGLTPEVRILGRVRGAEILEGSIFTDNSFVSRVKRELLEVFRRLGISGGKEVCLATGGVIDEEHMKDCKEVVYFGAHPPGKYYINPSGGVSFREIKGYGESESTCTFRGETVTSLWYPTNEQIDEVLAWREDGRPCVYKEGRLVAFTFPIDQLTSPRKAASLLLDYVLGGEALYQGEDEYVQAEIAKELPAGNYSIVVLGYLGRYLEQVSVEQVRVPEARAVLDIRREGSDAIVGVAGTGGVLSIREIGGKEKRSYSVESGKLYRIELSPGEWLITLSRGNTTLISRILSIPSYSLEKRGEQVVLLENGKPFSGSVEVLTTKGWKRAEITAGVLPEGSERVRVHDVEIPVAGKRVNLKPGDIFILLVILFALASGLVKTRDRDEIFIVFPEAVEAEPEREVEVSAEEVEEAMRKFSASLGYDRIPLTAEEVRMALERYAPSVAGLPALSDVEALLREMCSSGIMLSEAGYYAPASWCRDQSILHVVMCRLAHEKLTIMGVEAEIITRRRVDVVERRVVAERGIVRAVESRIKKRANLPDVVGMKGRLIYLVECETGKTQHAIPKLKKLLLKAIGFPENFIIWVIGTPEVVEKLKADEEVASALAVLEEWGRVEVQKYHNGRLF